MEIFYKKNDLEIFTENWKKFVTSYEVGFRYLPQFLKYTEEYSKNKIDDFSFVVIENLQVVGIAYLPIELIDNFKSISINNDYLFSPVGINERVEKFIFNEIDKIAKNLKLDFIKFQIEPTNLFQSRNYNFLLNYDFIDKSSADMMVDLMMEESVLWARIRGSYRPLINQVLKSKYNQYEFKVMDKNNLDYNLHETYRELHRKAAGRVTRSKDSFDNQFEMVKNGNGMLLLLSKDQQIVSASYFLFHKLAAVYFSSADDPDLYMKGTAITHANLWMGIVKLKEMGVVKLQLSPPADFSKISGFGCYSDDKKINIAFFKKGMGGDPVTLYRGMKYFSMDILVKDLDTFKVNLIKDHVSLHDFIN
jgi:hypothetical protein